MRYAVTGTQMKKIDQDTIQRIGIPSVVLMERAALAVAEEAKTSYPDGKTWKHPDRIPAVLQENPEFWQSAAWGITVQTQPRQPVF